MDKLKLANKIKLLEGLSETEKTELLNILHSQKKYGLVWEDKAEDVEKILTQKLPVLIEIPELRITANTEEQNLQGLKNLEGLKQQIFSQDKFDKVETPEVTAPDHILIEGDNLHALTALTFTHEGKIDVIYIDPPYNTGNKDFIYNDKFVDKEDSYRHSKWLSFMHKRLLIAKRLLKDTGVIFISIDDNEQAQLKMLCDEVFGEENFLGVFLKQSKIGGGSDSKFIVKEHEYALTYSKNVKVCNEFFLKHETLYLKRYKEKDEFGLFFWDTFARPGLKHPMNYEIDAPDGTKIYNGWIRSKDRFEEDYKNGEIKIVKKGNSWSVQFKQRLNLEGKKPRSMTTDFGGTIEGKNEIREIFNDDRKFLYPKSTQYIKTLLSILNLSVKSYTVLDFFAGSGTTLHATMQLNAEDGGSRQCILVTNNENNIAREVCYERNKRVIQGYTNSKAEFVSGLQNNNLRYYKADFTPREPSLENKLQLTLLATDLLCIKENCFDEINTNLQGIINLQGFQNLEGLAETLTKEELRIFCNKTEQYICIIYNDLKIEESVEFLEKFIGEKNPEKAVKVYVFSNGQYPFTGDFDPIIERIELCALPEAIYKAYKHVIPAKDKVYNKEEETGTGEQELFRN